MQKNNYPLLYCLCMLFTVCSFGSILAQKAVIAGKVIDKETGEGLIGVSVAASNAGGNVAGAITDFDGNYTFEVDPGTYNITCKYTGYNNFVAENLDAKDGVVNTVDAPMEISGLAIAETVITATQIKNTDASLISLQKKSFAIQDGISSQQISRTGASDAADAMKQVTGAVVEGGKFIVMRGLGDRYSVSQLNGITMPSTDPYRNSSSLDLIPSQMIDNIVTLKTFTPDLPGNFTGGLVNITTKAIPDKFTFSINGNIGFNTQSSLIDNFLGHGSDAGDRDWIGYDDGGRELPGYLTDPAIQSQLNATAYLNARKASEDFNDLRQLLNNSTDDLSNVFTPTPKSTPLNHGLSVNIGDRFKLFGNDLGVSLGGNFSRKWEHYENGLVNTYQNTASDQLFGYQELVETKSTESPHVGGLLSLTYKLGLNNSIGFNSIYNNDADIVGRNQEGRFVGQLSDGNATYLTSALEFIQREYASNQVTGRHVLPNVNDIEINWAGSWNKSSQVEPDTRYLSYSRSLVEEPDTTYFFYAINNAEFREPFHFWRDLQDRSQEYKLDITIPFLRQGREGSSNQIKIGGLYSSLERDFTEYQYTYARTGGVPSSIFFDRFNGDIEGFFDYANQGVIDTTTNPTNPYTIGYYYTNQVNNKNFYNGTQDITAGYAMAVYNITSKLKVVAGARVEQSKLFVQSRDTSLTPSDLDLTDVLPSVSLIYSLTERTNLRLVYSRTLARPNLRELAPFEQFDTKNGFFNIGNPLLKRTLIDNFDVRYEFYPKPGELLAVSGFYKNFKDPILRQYTTTASIPELGYVNIDEARVFGAEIEFRKNLGFIGGNFMQNMFLATNLALINSVYDIPKAEVEQAQSIDPLFDQTTRPFQGQAPYIVNFILSYVNPDNGWESSLAFNVSGRRLFSIGLFATPDIYEEPVPLLNFNISKKFGNHYQIGFSAENILNPDIRKTLEYRGDTYDSERYNTGATFGLSFGYFIR